jgi:phage N-6-adenine-methyltransferase
VSKLSLSVQDPRRVALVLATTPAEVKSIETLAAAAKRYATSLEDRNVAAEIQLRAGRRGGEMLIEMADNGTRAKNRNRQGSESPPVTLAELGIEPMRSSRWQWLARLSEDKFENYLEQTKAQAEPVTEAGLHERGGAMFTSDTGEWYTPREVIAAAVEAMGSIDLDPCAEPAKGVPAVKHFTREDDGLRHQWRGRVYMNPPYGREIGEWVDKLAEEFEYGNVTQAVALVPARTDTSWWAHLPASTVCFFTGRLTFSEHPSPAPFPSAACYLGSNQTAFAKAFIGLGLVYVRLETDAAA